MNTTKTAQFTPGPWTQDDLFIVAENGDVPVPICDCDVENFLDVAQANATLIAAAPAMYEAIKRVIEHRQRDYLDNTIEPYCLLVAVLAQAEGRKW